EDAAVRLLFVGPEFEPRAAALRALCPRLRTVVVLGDAGEPGLAAFCAGASAADPGLEPDPDELAVQMYTSGTSGRPRGVMLAHRSFFAVTALLRAARDPWLGWSADDVTICGMPSFHIGGLWWTMTTLDAGATLVVLDAFAGWKVLQKIERYQV